MKEIYLLDGGVGQEIYKRAGKPNSPMWSASVMMERPEIVKEVHKDFIKAGATIIKTNNYTCTPSRLKRDSKIELFEKLQLQALDLALSARKELNLSANEVSIAACLPPLIGSYTIDKRDFLEIKNEYEKIVDIQTSDIDLFLIETIPSIKEAKAAVEACLKKNIPIWLSFTLSDEEPSKLRSGEFIEEAIDSLKEYPIDAILFNCSFPETIDQGVFSLRNSKFAYGAYANAFTSVNPLKPGGVASLLSARLDINEKKYASHAMKWIEKGASIVGGCCEVGPSYISYLNKELNQNNFKAIPLKKKTN